jgi:hypothetical protein
MNPISRFIDVCYTIYRPGREKVSCGREVKPDVFTWRLFGRQWCRRRDRTDFQQLKVCHFSGHGAVNSGTPCFCR